MTIDEQADFYYRNEPLETLALWLDVDIIYGSVTFLKQKEPLQYELYIAFREFTLGVNNTERLRDALKQICLERAQLNAEC